MKAVTVALLAAAGLVFSGVAHADAALAQAKGCLACHDAAANKLGPAYKEVAKKYAGKKDAEATLANHIQKGTGAGLGWQKEGKASMPMMPANNVTADEAKKLAKWVLATK